MTVNVALGTNDKDQQIQALMMIGNVQKEMLQAGKMNMVDDSKLYNTVKKLVEATGFRHVEYFFKDPSMEPPPQPPPPDPQAQAAMMIAQAEVKKAETAQMEVQLKQQIAQQDFAIERMKLENERMKLQLEAEKAGLQGLQMNRKLDDNKEIQTSKLVLEAAKVGNDAVQKVEDRQQKAREAQAARNHDIIRDTMQSGEDESY